MLPFAYEKQMAEFGDHFYITGPWVSRAEDEYGQFVYITLHKNWFIETFDAELDGIIKRILGQSNAQ
jgi:hypothetical protein